MNNNYFQKLLLINILKDQLNLNLEVKLSKAFIKFEDSKLY